MTRRFFELTADRSPGDFDAPFSASETPDPSHAGAIRQFAGVQTDSQQVRSNQMTFMSLSKFEALHDLYFRLIGLNANV